MRNLITAKERKAAECELLIQASPIGDDFRSVAALSQFSHKWHGDFLKTMKLMVGAFHVCSL
jgi:hypothetical protein